MHHRVLNGVDIYTKKQYREVKDLKKMEKAQKGIKLSLRKGPLAKIVREILADQTISYKRKRHNGNWTGVPRVADDAMDILLHASESALLEILSKSQKNADTRVESEACDAALRKKVKDAPVLYCVKGKKGAAAAARAAGESVGEATKDCEERRWKIVSSKPVIPMRKLATTEPKRADVRIAIGSFLESMEKARVNPPAFLQVKVSSKFRKAWTKGPSDSVRIMEERKKKSSSSSSKKSTKRKHAEVVPEPEEEGGEIEQNAQRQESESEEEEVPLVRKKASSKSSAKKARRDARD